MALVPNQIREPTLTGLIFSIKIAWEGEIPEKYISPNINVAYPAWSTNLHNELERSTMLSMAKSTSSITMFNSFLYVYQRVYHVKSPRVLGKSRSPSQRTPRTPFWRRGTWILGMIKAELRVICGLSTGWYISKGSLLAYISRHDLRNMNRFPFRYASPILGKHPTKEESTSICVWLELGICMYI